jgi:HEAT repeat protein
MTPRGRLLAGLCLLAGAGLGVALLINLREPSYQGRTLTEWLDQANDEGAMWGRAPSEDAAAAVRAIGPRAVPILLDMVSTKDTRWRELLEGLADNPRFPIHLHVRQSEEVEEIGSYGFYWLGNSGKSAVPTLVTLLNDNDYRIRSLAAFCLGAIGEPSPDAIAALINGLGKPDQPRPPNYFSEKVNLAQALGEIGPPARAAVPALSPLTNSTDDFVAASAELALIRIQQQPLLPYFRNLENSSNTHKWSIRAMAIGRMSTNGEAAVPFLIAALQNTNLQNAALQALAHVHSHPELCIPAVRPLLQSTNQYFRSSAIGLICAFGRVAKPLVPMDELTRCLDDPDPGIRKQATNAVWFFDPEAAAKAGITAKPD